MLACRAIFEAGEKLHAVAAVREAETRSAVAARAAGKSGASKLLDTVIQAAGLSSTSMVCSAPSGSTGCTVSDSLLPSVILVDTCTSLLHRCIVPSQSPASAWLTVDAVLGHPSPVRLSIHLIVQSN